MPSLAENTLKNLAEYGSQQQLIRELVSKFLDGKAVSPSVYEPSNWTYHPDYSLDDYPIEDALYLVQKQSIGRRIIPGRNKHHITHSEIPNMIGIYDINDYSMVVKIGPRKELEANATALGLLGSLINEPYLVMQANSMYLLNDTTIAMSITPKTTGKEVINPLQLKPYNSHLESYLQLKIGFWMTMAGAYSGTPGAFTDILSPGNIFEDKNLNQLAIVDADLSYIPGKMAKNYQWISGAIASHINGEILQTGYKPSDFDMEYNLDEKKLSLPRIFLEDISNAISYLGNNP